MNVIRPQPKEQEATERLAAWCANAPRDWSAKCLDGARRAFVDTIAVMVAGQDIACTTGTDREMAS